MITENDVIKAMMDYLKNIDYTVKETCTTHQRGIDIVSETIDGVPCYIEAKGGTSSKSETNRFGQPFSHGQAYSHISVAITKCFQIQQKYLEHQTIVGIALP